MEFKKEPDLFWSQPRMVAFPVAYTWSRDSATTLAWIVCGQTGWTGTLVMQAAMEGHSRAREALIDPKLAKPKTA